MVSGGARRRASRRSARGIIASSSARHDNGLPGLSPTGKRETVRIQCGGRNELYLCDRRIFLKGALCLPATSAGLPFGRAAAAPSMSIAKYKSQPVEPDGIAEEARRLTRQAVDALGGMGRFVSKGDVVWVKPNIGWDRRPEQAATTNPDLVAAVVEMCYQAGARRVLVSDNPCNEAQRTFPRSGIQQAAEKAGARSYFLDPRKYRKMAVNGRLIKEWEIYTEAVEADKFINLPIVKQHSLCRATLGMKNLMGILGGPRNRLHQDIGASLADLAGFIKPGLVIMDAVRVLTANGPVGGSLADVKRVDTVIAGIDQVAVDACGATLLGIKPQDIGYIAEAGRRGLGRIDFDALAPRTVLI